MIILFIGDIVGSPGRKAVREALPRLLREHGVDFVIANGENAAGGFGITRSVADQIFDLGVHVLTSGNHIWDKKEVLQFIDREPRLLRPANYPPGVPGAGFNVFATPGAGNVGVLNLAGRVFMSPVDCPFQYAGKHLPSFLRDCRILIVDFHAEATSEKIAFARMVDGRVTAVLGTHTHVQTADERILPKGTAFITDAGMTGPLESVIGVEPGEIIEKFLLQIPRKFDVAPGPWIFNSVLLDVDEETGGARSIRRISLTPESLS